MFCMLKKRKKYTAYVSKHNSNREKQVIHLMILSRVKRKRSKALAMRARSEGRKTKSYGQRLQHYLVLKKLSALLRGITAKTKQKPKFNHIKEYAKIKTFVMQLCPLKTQKYWI